MRKFLLDIVTEPGEQNHTICIARVISIIGVLQYLAMAWFHYFQHHVFDPQGFALGFGGLLGGIGVALGLKKDSK